MVEYLVSNRIIPGHHYDHDKVKYDLYILLLMFLGDKAICKLDNDLLRELADSFAHNEISRILISSAVSIRISFDKSYYLYESGLYEGGIQTFKNYFIDCDDFICGKLNVAGESKDLKLREACNKIIHANKVHLDIETPKVNSDFKDYNTTYLNPIIHLHGEDKKKIWKAELDIIKYVEVGSKFMSFYP